jgi:hypothetical protein
MTAQPSDQIRDQRRDVPHDVRNRTQDPAVVDGPFPDELLE